MSQTVLYGDRLAPRQVTLSAAKSLTTADSETEFILDAAAGDTITLPPLSSIGTDRAFKCKFTVGAAFATTNFVVKSSEGDNMNGSIVDMGSTPAVVIGSGEDQVNFVASAETIGDYCEFISDKGNSQWIFNGMCAANGGITTTDPS